MDPPTRPDLAKQTAVWSSYWLPRWDPKRIQNLENILNQQNSVTWILWNFYVNLKLEKKMLQFSGGKRTEESESLQAEGEPWAVGNPSIRPRPLWSPKFRCPGRTTAHGIRLCSWNPEKLADGWCFSPWFYGWSCVLCVYIYRCMYSIYIYICVCVRMYTYICIICVSFPPVVQDWTSINSSMAFHGIWISCSRNPLALDTKKRMNG